MAFRPPSAPQNRPRSPHEAISARPIGWLRRAYKGRGRTTDWWDPPVLRSHNPHNPHDR